MNRLQTAPNILTPVASRMLFRSISRQRAQKLLLILFRCAFLGLIVMGCKESLHNKTKLEMGAATACLGKWTELPTATFFEQALENRPRALDEKSMTGGSGNERLSEREK
jgi:hypothetical protein